jgi:hypothetical protein
MCVAEAKQVSGPVTATVTLLVPWPTWREMSTAVVGALRGLLLNGPWTGR